MKIIKGQLSFVARTAGIKLKVSGVETDYINPTPEAKKNILENLERIKKLIGQDVELTIEDDNLYSTLQASDSSVHATEEVIKEKPVISNPYDDFKNTTITNLSHSEPKNEKQCVSKLEDNQYFNVLYKESDMEVETKGSLNLKYISWASAWQKLKEHYPDSNFKVYENKEGMPYFHDAIGGFVKVSVTVCGLTHICHMPIIDNKNQPIKPDKIDSFKINTSIQRALAKCCALHGLGLKIYMGEDLKDL